MLQEFHKMQTIKEKFNQISPFVEDSSSIGSIANEVQKMEGKDRFKYTLTRSEQVKTLPTKTSVKLSSKS